jgi:hypothetical protein
MLAADTPDYVEQRNVIQELMLTKSGNKPNPKRPRELAERNVRQRTGGIHEVCGEQEPAHLDAYRQGVTWGLVASANKKYTISCQQRSPLPSCFEAD